MASDLDHLAPHEPIGMARSAEALQHARPVYDWLAMWMTHVGLHDPTNPAYDGISMRLADAEFIHELRAAFDRHGLRMAALLAMDQQAQRVTAEAHHLAHQKRLRQEREQQRTALAAQRDQVLAQLHEIDAQADALSDS